MILPKERDPRLITVRRGGSLTDADHRLLAEGAGFEPAELAFGCFQDSCVQPLRHPSASPRLGACPLERWG